MNARSRSVVFFAVVMTGCVTVPQSPDPAELWQHESAEIGTAFRSQVATNRQLGPIRTKTALMSPRDITFAMLTDTSRPTESERAAILEYAAIRETFIRRLHEVDERYQNPFRRVAERQQQAVSAVWADLYNGAITYGEAARKRQEIDVTANEARDRMKSKIAAEALAAEQAALQRLSTYLVLQQSLKQSAAVPAPPVQPQAIRLQTTCKALSGMLFCN